MFSSSLISSESDLTFGLLNIDIHKYYIELPKPAKDNWYYYFFSFLIPVVFCSCPPNIDYTKRLWSAQTTFILSANQHVCNVVWVLWIYLFKSCVLLLYKMSYSLFVLTNLTRWICIAFNWIPRLWCQWQMTQKLFSTLF